LSRFFSDSPITINIIQIASIFSTPLDEIADDISLLLDKVDQFEIDRGRHVTVFLARIIDFESPYPPPIVFGTVALLNEYIQVMADNRIMYGDDIIVVDMENALTYPDDIHGACHCHPTDEGYQKMANTWLASLECYFGVTIARIGNEYFTSLQEAYDSAFDGDFIQIHGINIDSILNANRNISVNIDGGYSCDFSEKTGSTILNSNITISNGTVMIGNLVTE